MPGRTQRGYDGRGHGAPRRAGPVRPGPDGRERIREGDPGVVVKVRNHVIGHLIPLGSQWTRDAIDRHCTGKTPRAGPIANGDSPECLRAICSCKFDTILSSWRSPSFVGAVVSKKRHTISGKRKGEVFGMWLRIGAAMAGMAGCAVACALLWMKARF